MGLRIAVINPPFFTAGLQPSLGTGYVNALLRKAGHEVWNWDFDFLIRESHPELALGIHRLQMLNAHPLRVNFLIRPELLIWSLQNDPIPREVCSAEEAELILALNAWAQDSAAKVLEIKPVLVVMSSHITSVFMGQLLAQAFKRKLPRIRIILGGPGVALPEIRDFILRLGNTDAIIVGEAEGVISSLAEELSLGGPEAVLTDGVATQFGYRPHEYIPNLEGVLETPDFRGLPSKQKNLSIYSKHSQPEFPTWYSLRAGAIPVASSRGCAFKCTFCSESAYWKRFRPRPIEEVISEIEHQVKAYSASQITFSDSLLNPGTKRLGELLSGLAKRALDITIPFAYMTPRAIPAEQVTELVRCGFRVIAFGIDGASDSLLRSMKKGTNTQEQLEVLTAISQAGIFWYSGLIVGHPGETEQDIEEGEARLIELAARLHDAKVPEWSWPLISATPLRIEPMSPLYTQRQKYGIELRPYTIPLPSTFQELAPVVEPLLQEWANPPDPEKVERHRQRLSAVWPQPAAQRKPFPRKLLSMGPLKQTGANYADF